MKKLLKKIFMPLFLSVLCGFICGRLMFSIYEDKENNILSSNIVYLLEDKTYSDYDTMKASIISNNYIYYEEDGKYNTAVAMTKDETNIDIIKRIYGKDLTITKYLQSDSEINKKIDEYDEKIRNANSDTEIKTLIEEMNNIYKGRDDIKMAKIS